MFRFPAWGDSITTPSGLLNWIGRDFLNKVVDTLPPKYRKMVESGLSRALVHFPDGLGKVRYIAISD